MLKSWCASLASLNHFRNLIVSCIASLTLEKLALTIWEWEHLMPVPVLGSCSIRQSKLLKIELNHRVINYASWVIFHFQRICNKIYFVHHPSIEVIVWMWTLWFVENNSWNIFSHWNFGRNSEIVCGSTHVWVIWMILHLYVALMVNNVPAKFQPDPSNNNEIRAIWCFLSRQVFFRSDDTMPISLQLLKIEIFWKQILV